MHADLGIGHFAVLIGTGAVVKGCRKEVSRLQKGRDVYNGYAYMEF